MTTSIGAWALAPFREYIEAQLDKIAGFTDPPDQEKMANKLAAEIGAIGLRCLWTEKYGLPRGDCTASLSGNTVHISCSRVCRLYTPTTVVRGGCSVAGVGL